MKKNLILSLSFLLILSAEVWAQADAIAETQIVKEEQKTVKTELQTEAANDENKEDLSAKEDIQAEDINVSSPKVELEIEKSLPTQEINLPTCENEKLQEVAKDYVNSYFANSKNEGTLYRRYKHFILQNLNQFKEENIANYKTAQTRPVSDIIADIKVNKGIPEENIRLCKNQSKDHYAGKMYMIIYPQETDVFQVNLINLTPYKKENKDTGFIFTN